MKSDLLKSLAVGVALVAGSPAWAASVTTWHNDIGRTGWNSQETVLTPANVGGLHMTASVAVDEEVNAQPLVVPGMSIAGGTHDVVYVATQNNTLYAFDAATGKPLVQRHFGTPMPQSLLPGQCGNNSPVIGISATPVIDLVSRTMYVMVYTSEAGGPVYRLHAVDLGTLNDKLPPAVVQASASLVDGSRWIFNAHYSRQRPGLAEASGNIYAAFGSFCDVNANLSRGWLLGWKASSLAPLASNHLDDSLLPAQSPRDFFLSSIWMSGAAPAIDNIGQIYVVTGNSDPSGTTWNSVSNLSESILKIAPDLSRVLQFFTPSNVVILDKADADFGSGGAMYMPFQPGGAALISAAGKVGTMYLTNRWAMGGNHNPDRVFGEYQIGACTCSQSYFNGWDGVGRVVSSGGNDVMVWRINLSPQPHLIKEVAMQPLPDTVQDHGFFTSITSNGSANALIWAVGRPIKNKTTNVILYAFDPRAAAQQGKTGWLFSAVAGTWPYLGGNADVVPTVANGRVYVGTYKQLAIFGLGTGAAAQDPFFVPGTSMKLPNAGAFPGGALSDQLALAGGEAMQTEAPRSDLPFGVHEIYGTIKRIDGHELYIITRGQLGLIVDADKAIKAWQTGVLLEGEKIRVIGTIQETGVMVAKSIIRAKPSPEAWPEDR